MEVNMSFELREKDLLKKLINTGACLVMHFLSFLIISYYFFQMQLD